jgi:hypothetical protein
MQVMIYILKNKLTFSIPGSKASEELEGIRSMPIVVEVPDFLLFDLSESSGLEIYVEADVVKKLLDENLSGTLPKTLPTVPVPYPYPAPYYPAWPGDSTPWNPMKPWITWSLGDASYTRDI